MKVVLTFLIGVAVGAAAGLLLAPSSGEDLRHQLRVEAERNRAALEAQMRKEMEEVQDRLAKVQADLDEAARKTAADVAETLDEVAEEGAA